MRIFFVLVVGLAILGCSYKDSTKSYGRSYWVDEPRTINKKAVDFTTKTSFWEYAGSNNEYDFYHNLDENHKRISDVEIKIVRQI